MNKATKFAIVVTMLIGVLVPVVYVTVSRNTSCNPAENAEYISMPWNGNVINDVCFIGDFQEKQEILGYNFGQTIVRTITWQYYVVPSVSLTMQLNLRVQSTAFNQTDVENALGEGLCLCNGTAKIFVFSIADSRHMLFSVLVKLGEQWFISDAPLIEPLLYADKINAIAFEIYRYLRVMSS